MTMSDEVDNSGDGLRVFFSVATLLVAISAALLFLTSKLWIGLAMGWIGFGLFLYTIILRFVPPMPLLIKETSQNSPEPEPSGRPMRIREIPLMVSAILAISVIAPFFTVFLVPALMCRRRVSRQWIHQFPTSTKADVREFLNIITHPAKDCWFSPDEKLIDVYRDFYGPAAIPDQTEVENLANQIARRYGVQVLNSLHEEMTTGKLYALIQRH